MTSLGLPGKTRDSANLPRPPAAAARLTQWTAPTTALRFAPGAVSADTGAEAEDHNPAAEHSLRDDLQQGDPDRSDYWAALKGGAVADEDMRRPGERLHVYRSEGVSIDPRDGGIYKTVHKFNAANAFSRGEIVLTSPSLASEALAVSCIREDAKDVRPALLLMLYAQDMGPVQSILTYGIGYLTAWADRVKLMPKTDRDRRAEAIRWAVADALADLYSARQERAAPAVSDGSTWSAPGPQLSADFRRTYAAVIRAGMDSHEYGDACQFDDGTPESIAWLYGWEWAERRSELQPWQRKRQAANRQATAPTTAAATDTRAAAIGIREGSYKALRRKALGVFEMRLCEALSSYRSFRDDDGIRPGQSDGDGFDRESAASWWSDGQAMRSRRSPVRTIYAQTTLACADCLSQVAGSTPAKL